MSAPALERLKSSRGGRDYPPRELFCIIAGAFGKEPHRGEISLRLRRIGEEVLRRSAAGVSWKWPDEAEQIEMARLKREVIKLKAERDILKSRGVAT